MRNASSLKPKAETPKTPGGISKSLLTPCRRVGLSRNWRKSIASPFNSPLASTEAKQDNVENRKRKESLEPTPLKTETDCQESEKGTPTRKVELPRRKKSKILLNSISKTCEDDSSQLQPPESPKSELTEEKVEESVSKDNEIEALEVVATPVRLKSRSKSKVSSTKDGISEVSTPVQLKSKSISKKISPKSMNFKVKETYTNPVCTKANDVMDIEKENLEDSCKLSVTKPIETNKKIESEKENSDTIQTKNKERKVKSPNNLTKECIVVIQKKIFKNQLKENELLIKVKSNEPMNTVSQALFHDSDSDDVPLNCLNKTETKNEVESITIDDDDDFATSKSKLKKTSSKKTVKENTNTKSKSTTKSCKELSKTVVNVHNLPSQSSVDDDDFFEKKKTILIRKTYDKVMTPLKAKSTGSITQKDIEDLTARIETKKKMLLAKSMTDTKELRELIKKWQKGCQDALMELMDLMKTKCPDQSMEYSQFLQTLKIPASLVGYDSDNDCFVTPEDENIILSHIK